MRIFSSVLVALFVLKSIYGYSQTNIIASLDSANPIQPNTAITSEEKIRVHQAFLKKAVAEKDNTKQFYGLIYLCEDNLDKQDYEAVADYAINAGNIADKTGNKSWQGFVKIKLGWVDFMVNQDKRAAIQKCQLGIKLCAEVNDQLCAAECMEQMAVMYSYLNMYDSSLYFFNVAIPVLKKFPNSHLGSAYNNFSNLLAYQGRSAEGIPYIDTAIAIARKNKDARKENLYLVNRALLLYEIKKYDEALALLKDCIVISEKNNWQDNLKSGYDAIAPIYNVKGNYKLAYEYTEKYHALEDELYGAAVKNKVARLTAKNENLQKELVIKQSQVNLLTVRQKLAFRNWVIGVFIFLFLLAVILWILYNRRVQKEKLENRSRLDSITRILIEKNSLLTALQENISVEEFNKVAPESPVETNAEETATPEEKAVATNTNSKISTELSDFEKNIYNQRILTAADWSAFKIYFEKAYPGYLLQLRNAYRSITEAEERLFLFIKLKLTNKEAAAILGISPDSVKKTRVRLRRRLALDEKISLDKFITDF